MKNLKLRIYLVTVLGIAIGASQAEAALKLHPLFSENAVLRRGSAVPVWGSTDKAQAVTVRFAGQSVTVGPAGGTWMAVLRDLKNGGPHSLEVTQGDERIEAKNILVGEVWLCGGQSNMAWSVQQSDGAQEATAAAKNDRIRLFTVSKKVGRTGASAPQWDLEGQWMLCTPETVANFSAVGYYFGRDLEKARKVPVGLISSNVGGTRIERWMSAEKLASRPELVAAQKPTGASDLYNSMIAPLAPYLIRGVLWYQGEGNIDHAFEYRELLPALIEDWRAAFKQPALPFIVVQLAPVGRPTSDGEYNVWAELREAQLLTTQATFNTALCVITDLGHETVHPPRKAEVGSRLAKIARNLWYGEHDIAESGPINEGMSIDGDRVTLRFQHADRGLVAEGGPPTGFRVAGEDRKFHPAEATLEGKTVVVRSTLVPRPVAVRYGWDGYPVVNLANKDGMPASPFRTDAWKLVSQDNPPPKPKASAKPVANANKN